MGLNILFWNCQGIRPKRKELELYIKENEFDIVALNETFLNKKHNFKIPGYDTIRNDRSTGLRGGVAFLVKHGLLDYRFDVGNEHEFVADADAQTLIKLVKFLKRGKAPGPDNIHNEVFRLGTTTSLYHHLARLFTSSIKNIGMKISIS